jgi:tRNA pseudouridine38-40 synthase
MQRFKVTFSYDGTGFAGFQLQPRQRTVQGELEAVLTKLHKGKPSKVIGSGRTDAGVHAKGQVVHFDSEIDMGLSKWLIAFNTNLPADIVILNVEKADESFHARYNTTGKEYRYLVHLSSKGDPFVRNYAYQFRYKLDIQAIKESVNYLIGTHDFTSFCSAKTEMQNKVRTIEKIELVQEGEQLMFRFVGNGFLYNMVRILVGTLMEVGAGRKTPESIPGILEGKDRNLAGKTAPAHGLYLWEVYY